MPISRIPGVGLDSGSSGVAPSNLSTGAPSWDGSGNVTCLSSISVGNATPTTSGFGITFPATQSASSNANTLDDYEEGTFTPTVIGSVTAGTATYTQQLGRYTKIGNRVLFTIFVDYSGGTGAGLLRLSGLPFTSQATANNLNILSTYVSSITMAANNYALSYVVAGSIVISMDQTPVGGGVSTNMSYDAAGAILISGQYESAA